MNREKKSIACDGKEMAMLGCNCMLSARALRLSMAPLSTSSDITSTQGRIQQPDFGAEGSSPPPRLLLSKEQTVQGSGWQEAHLLLESQGSNDINVY